MDHGGEILSLDLSTDELTAKHNGRWVLIGGDRSLGSMALEGSISLLFP